MSIQLSLFWESADQIEWYWPGDTNVYKGSLEELLDQKQEKNLAACVTRLFLPEYWFSSLELSLPEKTRRLSGQALKFAAEEYLAQDIDSVHLVLKNKPQDGSATVIVTELDRFRQVLNTLQARGLHIIEAFNAQWFEFPESQTNDIVLKVAQDSITLCSRDQVFKVHPKGFTQWFEMWATQNSIAEDAAILLVSHASDGIAKSLVTEFEASGLNVQWLVQDSKKLIDWHDQSEGSKQPGNLITSEFSQKSTSTQTKYWVPSLAAASSAFVLWILVSTINTAQVNKKVEQTWKASENVFLQVFGKNKRIQRPLMVREMRSLASDDGSSGDGANINALVVLNDLSIAATTLKLEDFRFNSDRNEAFFTLVQGISEEDDAFSLFESLKTKLGAKGYTVEYSANQDKDNFRAKFKSVYGEQG